MRHYTGKEIKSIIADMMENETRYVAVRNGYPDGRIWFDWEINRHGQIWGCIHWQHYGESSCRRDEFRWLLETIFNNCDEIVPGEFCWEEARWIPRIS